MAVIRSIKTSFCCTALFKKFAHRPYAFFLDSGMNPKGLGKFSFMGADPHLIFKSKGHHVSLYQEGSWRNFHTDPLKILQKLLKMPSQAMTSPSPIPFLGGAVGYMAYDSYPLFEPIVQSKPDELQLPDIFFGFYDGILAMDNDTQETFAIASGIYRPPQKTLDQLQSIIESPEPITERDFSSAAPLKKEPLRFLSNFKKEAYLDAIKKIKGYIADGEIYQVNLSQQFHCFSKANPIDILAMLRQHYPAPFGAYLDGGDFQLISNSPERFFKVEENRIETCPIKGTRPRGDSSVEDDRLKKELAQSEKERAELLMITDLERNDLSKIAMVGSVKVKEMFSVETYPTVFHLASTIEAKLKKDVDLIACFQAMFPGGSITGAPKIRSMAVIDEIEPIRRGIYTGTIGYCSVNGNMDFNIAIRTLIHQNGRYTFGVGGGIVWDSIDAQEYEETLHKARALMSAIEQTEKNSMY